MPVLRECLVRFSCGAALQPVNRRGPTTADCGFAAYVGGPVIFTLGISLGAVSMHTKLLKSQKNEVFSAIGDAGLDPSEFEWSEVKTKWKGNGVEPIQQLTHRPTGYYFAFDRYQISANPRSLPSNLAAAEMDHERMNTWHGVLKAVSVWALIVRREYLEPDLWELSQSDKKLVVTQISDLDNTGFTAEEQQRLASSIKELREFLLASATQTDTQRKFIEARLQHLEEASGRLGRKDWITLAMGTLTNIVVGVSLAPEAARELLRVAGALLGWVVGSVHLIP